MRGRDVTLPEMCLFGAVISSTLPTLQKSVLPRFPVNDYLYPHNPLLFDPNDIYDGCPPYVISKCGKGTFLNDETDPAVLSARREFQKNVICKIINRFLLHVLYTIYIIQINTDFCSYSGRVEIAKKVLGLVEERR